MNQKACDCFATLVVCVSSLALIATAALIVRFDWLFPNSDDPPEFMRNAIIAVIAIGLGIPAGLSINRQWQSSLDKEKRRQLLKVLRRVFKKNISLLEQAAKGIDTDIVAMPTFSLEIATLETTTHIRYQLITDVDLAEIIDKAHFELLHVDRRIEILMKMMPFQSSTPETKGSIDDAVFLLEHLKRHNETDGLARAIESQIGKRNMRQSGIPIHELHIIRAKMGTLDLMVGHTTKDKGKDKMYKGGAVAHCEKAIKAIEKSLSGQDSGSPDRSDDPTNAASDAGRV